jgi:hypothetical protein
MANVTRRIAEVVSGPVFIIEAVPDGVVIVHSDRIGDSENAVGSERHEVARDGANVGTSPQVSQGPTNGAPISCRSRQPRGLNGTRDIMIGRSRLRVEAGFLFLIQPPSSNAVSGCEIAGPAGTASD